MMTVRVGFEPICLAPNRCLQRKETIATNSVMGEQHAQSGCVSRHVPKAVIQQSTLSDCRNSATRLSTCSGRLTDWRRLALRDDRSAHTVVSAMCLAATGIFWLSFTRLDPRWRELGSWGAGELGCEDSAGLFALHKSAHR